MMFEIGSCMEYKGKSKSGIISFPGIILTIPIAGFNRIKE